MSDTKGRANMPQQWLYMLILEYLCYHNEGYTTYHLTMKIPGLPSQRPDRISALLELMIKQGHIYIAWVSGDAKWYKITAPGREYYIKKGKALNEHFKMFQ